MKNALLILFVFYTYSLSGFNKVVIWGHKIHTHTHSYIHNGFYRAFQFFGYPTYWFDDQDDVSNFDFANSLFLTEGQVDKNIPLRSDCNYILHYCNLEKYKNFHYIILQVFTNNLCFYDSLGNEVETTKNNLIQMDKCIFYDITSKVIFMPWATDLFPHEIDEIKLQLPQVKKTNEVYWIGTLSTGPGGNRNEVDPFAKACSENHIQFIHKNPWTKGISMEDNINLIQKSYIAPAIVGTWQNKVGYIPCRIFKNISYGQMGITNSKTVYDLFEGKVIYNPDTYLLFYDAQEYINKMSMEELFELMDIVKLKHTYLNRVNSLLEFLDLVNG